MNGPEMMTDDDIRATCARFELAVGAIRRQGDVLVLVPEALDQLPEPDRLRQLARALTERGEARYVTLAIDEPNLPWP